METYRRGSPARNADFMSPLDHKGEVHVHRRRISRDQHVAPYRRSPTYYEREDYDDYDRHLDRSRSPNPPRRRSRHRDGSIDPKLLLESPLTPPDRLIRRDRCDSLSSSSDSDSSASSSHRRRKPKVRPCGSVCRPNPPPPKASPSDDEDYDSAAELKRRLKRRKDTLLTAGLATITTVAAGNGIYQNTKLYHARKNAVQEGEMCSHELEKLKTKATMMNLFSLGVVAIGLNNVRLGWMRHENTKKANREAEKAAWERRARREEREDRRRDARDERY